MIFRRFASTSVLPNTIKQLLARPSPTHDLNNRVDVHGWIKSIRRQKRVTFAMLADGSYGHGLQTVFTDPELAKTLTNGTAVRLTGRLADSPGKGQDKELQVEEVQVLGECDPEEYPIQKQALSLEFLRENVHLRARTDHISAMLRLRDCLQHSIHRYFQNEGFCYIHTPILTSNDCEGAGEAFRIAMPSTLGENTTSLCIDDNSAEPGPSKPNEFFSRPSYLTVSSQLHLEALATSMSRVYTLSPCFRAEKSQTNRHLAEFWMLEAEWAFINRVEDVCSLVEAMLRSCRKAAGDEIDTLWKGADEGRRKMVEDLLTGPQSWTRMTYTEAVKELDDYHSTFPDHFTFVPRWGKPLQSEHEKWLSERLVGGAVFVTDYPTEMKPFYMRINADGRTVGCFDLLIPHVGELVGGSLREERLPQLDDNIKRLNLDANELRWYSDLRKYGGTPHGGFGLGFERLVGWIGGIDNVRECIPVPRWAGKMLL